MNSKPAHSLACRSGPPQTAKKSSQCPCAKSAPPCSLTEKRFRAAHTCRQLATICPCSPSSDRVRRKNEWVVLHTWSCFFPSPKPHTDLFSCRHHQETRHLAFSRACWSSRAPRAFLGRRSKLLHMLQRWSTSLSPLAAASLFCDALTAQIALRRPDNSKKQATRARGRNRTRRLHRTKQ